jgi:hypothetical protein
MSRVEVTCPDFVGREGDSFTCETNTPLTVIVTVLPDGATQWVIS